MRYPWRLLVVLALASPGLRAEVKPNGLFGANMVLQQGRPVPVWGTAADGEQVTVSCAGQSATTVASAGRWRLDLPCLPVGGPYTMDILGSNELHFDNVLVGEVWVCSGQSNMAFTMNGTHDAERHLAEATDTGIRLATVPRRAAIEPLASVDVSWHECSPETVKPFSAVAYFFGQQLRRDLGVPIGLINTSYGGTPAEAWTDYGRLFLNPTLRPLTVKFETELSRYPERQVKYLTETLPAWRAQVQEARAAGRTPPRQPQAPPGPTHQQRPAGLYNAMIAPLVPYAIAGAIWYQGEANAGRPEEYKVLLPELIKCWRDAWGQGDFPFLIVQLASFMAITQEPTDTPWARLREAQLGTFRTVPRTGLAVITDVGEENDIHPKRKQPVGERLAWQAERLAYGRNLEWLGPIYVRHAIETDHLRCWFTHADGLRASAGELTGFTIAGAERVFHNARARVDGDAVVVWSPAVKHPVAVRYGWANYPLGNLVNRAGLLASPFRTDDWPRAGS